MATGKWLFSGGCCLIFPLLSAGWNFGLLEHHSSWLKQSQVASLFSLKPKWLWSVLDLHHIHARSTPSFLCDSPFLIGKCCDSSSHYNFILFSNKNNILKSLEEPKHRYNVTSKSILTKNELADLGADLHVEGRRSASAILTDFQPHCWTLCCFEMCLAKVKSRFHRNQIMLPRDDWDASI